MKLTLAKYSLITLVSGFLIAGAGCTQATPVEKVQPTAKKTVVTTTPSPTTFFTVGGLRLHTVPGVSFEKTVKNTAYLIPDDQNSARNLRLAITVTPSTLKNFDTELRDAHEKFTLKNGQGFRQNGVGGGSIYLIKIGQKAYAIMPELDGTPVPGADVPGGGLETTFDVVELLKTTEEVVTSTSNIIERGYKINRDQKQRLTGFVSPAGTFYKVPAKIASLQNTTEYPETITGEIAPQNQSNKYQIYLSTTFIADSSPNTVNLNKVYQYDLKTNELKEISIEKNIDHIISTIAIDGNKIILLTENINDDSSAGPCVSIWTTKKFKYLDLTQLEKGLQNYQVPAEKLAAEKQKEQKCEASDIKELM